MLTRAHNDDAGYDIYAPRDFGIHALQNAFLMLGVCVEIAKRLYRFNSWQKFNE